MQVDYIIVGQGICGTFLSWQLIKAGKKIIVIDEEQANTASKIAGSMINPVTGRRILRSWLIEELYPFAQQAYDDISHELGIEIARECEIINFHANEAMSSAWHERIAEGEDYISNIYNTKAYNKDFNFYYGAGLTTSSLIINMPLLLSSWREKLQAHNTLISQKFYPEELKLVADGVEYMGIVARKIIFCNGTDGINNKFFNKLPFAFSKGEALLVEIKGLSNYCIYKQGVTLIPQYDNIFWAGSSFEWSFSNALPSPWFLQKTTQALDAWLKIPYRIIDHKAAIRPASMDRRPFVGLHPAYPAVGILNGMGTKGCSLAPFFSHQLANHLISGSDFYPAVNISRFKKLLSVNQ